MKKKLSLFIFIVLSKFCFADQTPTEKVFLVVDGVYSVSSAKENIFPWLLEKSLKNGKNKDEILIGSACHFYEISYVRTNIENDHLGKSDLIKVTVSPGEFCDLSQVVFAHPTLISAIKWNNHLYMKNYAEVKFDENQKMYILDSDFISKNNFTNYYLDLNISKNLEACIDRNLLSTAKQEIYLNEPFSLSTDMSICFTKGVYLRDIFKK